MNPDGLPSDLVGAFGETALASAPAELPQKELSLRGQIRALGQYPEALVRCQSNEALAHALKHGFFFAETTEEFYVRFQPIIQAWLVKRGLDYHHAFDLAQNLLWHCRRHRLRDYDGAQGKVTTYLKRAAFHLWIEKAIRGRRNALLAPKQLDGEESAGIDRQIDQDLKELVYGALPGLAPAQRAVIVLAIKGKSPDELAEELGFVLLSQPGLLSALELAATEGRHWQPSTLTWNGHEFLGVGNDGTVCDEATTEEKESMPFEIIKALARKVAAFLFDIG
jgi:DNA-directed RNA polymerase specialized sigma24 family protein